MGNTIQNYGLYPDVNISLNQFKSAWNKHDSAHVGALEYHKTRDVLRDIAKLSKLPFEELIATKIIHDADKKESGLVQEDVLRKLLFSKTKLKNDNPINVDMVMLNQLMEMGFSKEDCLNALKQTKNIDDAITWLFENNTVASVSTKRPTSTSPRGPGRGGLSPRATKNQSGTGIKIPISNTRQNVNKQQGIGRENKIPILSNPNNNQQQKEKKLEKMDVEKPVIKKLEPVTVEKPIVKIDTELEKKQKEELKRKQEELLKIARELQHIRDEEQKKKEMEEYNRRELLIKMEWENTKKKFLSILGTLKNIPILKRILLFSTVEPYIRNIISSTSAATFERFRKIPASNTKFKENVIDLEVGVELMEACGFQKVLLESSLTYEQKTGEKNQPFYILKESETCIPILKKCHIFLTKYIRKWKLETSEVVIIYPGKKIFLQNAINNFQALNIKTDWKAGLEALSKYLINIISYPENEKFRNISIVGKGFASNLGQFIGSYDLMRSIGFLHNSIGKMTLKKGDVDHLPQSLKQIQYAATQIPPNSQWLCGKIPRSERYMAAIMCAGIGDAIGYHNGFWLDPEKKGEDKWNDCQKKGGLVHLGGGKLTLTAITTVYLATAEALLKGSSVESIIEITLSNYKDLIKVNSNLQGTHWYSMSTPKKFDLRQFPGNSPATRSMCIGLFYWHPSQLDELIRMTALNSFITDTHPIAFLGGFVSALFTSFAIQGLPSREWGINMIKLLPRVKECLFNYGFNIKESEEQFLIFEKKWIDYLQFRGLHYMSDNILFPSVYEFNDRDSFYSSCSITPTVGSSGYECCLIAYDSILWSSRFFNRQEMINSKIFMNDGTECWFQLLYHAAMYQGMTSSTAAIACAWYGAQNGLRGIPVQNYKGLGGVWKMQNIGNALESAKGKLND